MSSTILSGDCRDVLPTLETGSFDCVVTSPPYYGLRDYGVECQIGLEPTLDLYIEEMVRVCREVRRVLKPEGTFWLNLGDSYAATSKGSGGTGKGTLNCGPVHNANSTDRQKLGGSRRMDIGALKPKDLCGVPWRVAFALQADGWWLRSAIVWAKPNPMPESVRDRPTSAYEMVFLLTKSTSYFYDADAIAEPAETYERQGTSGVPSSKSLAAQAMNIGHMKTVFYDRPTRNARNVWTIAPKPFRGAHFATMPPDLAERCIKAGCPIGGSVLDPFGGAGTTGLVATRLGRHATLIELNTAYGEMAKERILDSVPTLPLVQVDRESIASGGP